MSLLGKIPLFAQLETSKWMFGNRAGLDFSTSPPSPIAGSAMNAWEGVASIADANGELLFYSDGITVWNRNHTAMPNGTGLNGNPSSAQSGIIVQNPSDPTIYYVFSVPHEGGTFLNHARLYYSVVDMSLSGGLGDVVNGQKNINLTPNHRVQEKVTAVLHCNGEDIWILAHEYGSNVFLKLLIEGDNPPTFFGTQAIGESWAGNSNGSIGIMKASSDGRMVAETANSNDRAQVLDFDNLTGELSNPRTITNVGWSYGVEFSPNNEVLYLSTWYHFNPRRILYQYDLTAQNVDATRVEINTSSNVGAIQLALDGKLYVARNTDDGGGANNGRAHLGIINNPNNYDGTPQACEWIEEGVFLGGNDANPSAGQLSRYGLPNFLQSYFNESIDFTYQDTCFMDETTFFPTIPFEYTSVSWDFGGQGSSTEETPSFVFTEPGTYEITLIAEGPCQTDEIVKTIEIIESQVLTIEGPQEVCIGEQVTFTVNTSNEVNWTVEGGQIVEGQNSNVVTITWEQEGEFSVEGSIENSGACPSFIEPFITEVVDEIILTFNLPTQFCMGDEAPQLPAISDQGVNGQWNGVVNTEAEGTYTLVFTPNPEECAGQFEYEYVVLDCETEEPCEDPVIDFEALPSSGMAPLEVVFVNNSTGADSYEWNFGNGLFDQTSEADNVSTTYEEEGVYVVQLIASNGECVVSAEIEIVVYLEAPISFDMPNVFTPNGDGVNDYFSLNLKNVKELDLVIVNRWGNVVFQTNEVDSVWDGIDEKTGKPCTEGVYFYKFTLVGDNNEEVNNHGYVHLVRD